MKDPTATRYDTISYLEVLRRAPAGDGCDGDLAVHGQPAADLVFNLRTPGNLRAGRSGEPVGSVGQDLTRFRPSRCGGPADPGDVPMDVNDLKGLIAEVKTRMDAGVEHVRQELATCAPDARRWACSRTCTWRPTARRCRSTRCGPVDPGPGAHRRAALRPAAAGRDREGHPASDLGLNPSTDGKVVRVPIPALTDERRKELSRHVHKLAEEGRNAATGPPRRERATEEAAQGPHDLRRRRAPGPRRRAEDHRRAHQAGRRVAEEEGRGAAGTLTRCPSRTWNARAPAALPCWIRADGIISASAASPVGAVRPARAQVVARETLRDREPSLWRYRELLPVFPSEMPISLGEGFTPLLHAAHLGA